MFPLRFRAAGAALALAVTAVPALAQNAVPPTGTYVTSPTQAPNTWYTDRYAPQVFENVATYQGRTGVLRMGVRDAGNKAARSATNQSDNFYDIQGRKYDLAPGAFTLAADLYVPGSWAAAANGWRDASLWGAAATGTSGAAPGTITAYPSIGFTNDPFYVTGGGGSFWYWDGSAVVLSGAAVNYGSWNTLGFSLDPSAQLITYFINGATVGSFSSVDGGVNATQFVNAFFQLYNFSTDFNPTNGQTNTADASGEYGYDAYFDVNAVSPAVVPEPGTMALAAAGLVVLAGAVRRRRAASVRP